MKQRNTNSGFHFLIFSSFFLIFFSQSVQSYQNYTVGDSLGWYDNTQQPDLNYQNWAAHKNFTLGDFLIFNTDNNHSVVQTYNVTTFNLCDYDNSPENDTIQWSEANPSATEPHSVSVAVPLLREGLTYFFSGDYDGEQCKHGQNMKINVLHGQGLPESLKDPKDQAPGPVTQQAGDDESAPDTIVPSNFDNPREINNDDDNDDAKNASSSSNLSMHLKLLDGKLNVLLVLLGIVCLF